MNKLVLKLTLKVSIRLGALRRLRTNLTILASKNIDRSMILPLFYYCDIACHGISATNSEKLESLKQRAGKIVTQSKHINLLEELGWTSLSNRRNYHQCISVYRCLHYPEPQILCDKVVLCNHTYNRRRNNMNIILPKMRTEIGKKTFSYSASKLFNILPAEIKNSETLLKFKFKLRKLFSL